LRKSGGVGKGITATVPLIDTGSDLEEAEAGLRIVLDQVEDVAQSCGLDGGNVLTGVRLGVPGEELVRTSSSAGLDWTRRSSAALSVADRAAPFSSRL
jgi:hypothetical protein